MYSLTSKEWERLSRFDKQTVSKLVSKISKRKIEAAKLNQMWESIIAPSIDSCWRMKFNKENKRTTKHVRRLYKHFKGAWPEETELHHTCYNKWCVNPKHIEPLTYVEHMKAHGKSVKVSFRAYNSYKRLIRDYVRIGIDQE